VSKNTKDNYPMYQQRPCQYLLLHGKWQITKSSKPCKTLFVNTPGIWKMFKGIEKKY